MRNPISALGPIWGLIWHERADMGANMRTLISARGPIWDFSYRPSQPISAPNIAHKNVKIVVLSSKSTVPAGDLDLEK